MTIRVGTLDLIQVMLSKLQYPSNWNKVVVSNDKRQVALENTKTLFEILDE
jgi:hypothetical protein